VSFNPHKSLGVMLPGLPGRPHRGSGVSVLPIPPLNGFDIMPQTEAQMRLFLGVDGSISDDLGDGTHMWRYGAGGELGALDEGTLKGLDGTFNMGNASGTPTYSLNADYELGAAGKQVLVIDGDLDQVATSGVNINMIIPAEMDSAEKSFLYTVAFTPDSDNDLGSIASRIIFHNRGASVGDRNGWRLRFLNNERKLRAEIDFDVGADTLVSTLTFEYDSPVFAVVVYDFADNKVKMGVAQGENLVFDEQALTGSGSFFTTERLTVGRSVTYWTESWGQSMRGVVGQCSSLEWDAAVPSGITAENVGQYLRYTAGLLSA